MTRFAWAVAAIAATDHVLALTARAPSTAFVLLVIGLVSAAVVQASAVIRSLLRGHTLGSLLSAIPGQGKAILLIALGYTLYRFLPLLAAAQAGGVPSAADWTLVGSTFALYMSLFGAYTLDLPPRVRSQPEPIRDGDFVEIPAWRMAERSATLHLAFVFGFLAVAPWLLEVNFPWIFIAMFGWIVLLNALTFWLLRCPRCRKLATRSPSGWASPLVGRECRWCGQPY